MTPKVIRCAIYTRKSTEEGLQQEFNSLDAQREAAEAFIKYLATPQAAETWARLGGFSSANKNVPASVYTDPIGRRAAVALETAPVVVRADRPFFFLLRHRPSGAILFTCRLTHPSP